MKAEYVMLDEDINVDVLDHTGNLNAILALVVITPWIASQTLRRRTPLQAAGHVPADA
jgi:hypothetical protein